MSLVLVVAHFRYLIRAMIPHIADRREAQKMAKSAKQLLLDASDIRRHAARIAKVNKEASDELKKQAGKLEMRAVRRMKQRVKPVTKASKRTLV